MNKFTTIRMRVSLLTGGLLFLILTAYSLFLYFSLSNQLLQALDARLSSSAEQWLVIVENEQGRLRFDEGDLLNTASLAGDDVIRLLSPSGELLDERSDQKGIPILAPPLGGFVTLPDQIAVTAGGEDIVDKRRRLRLLTVPIEFGGEVIAYLQIGSDLEAIEQALADLRALLLIAAPAVILLAAMAGHWLTGRALAPIEAIRSQAALIGAHDLRQRLGQNLSNDEVGRLAETFNEMLTRLDSSFRHQRQFTADASHELRTPLAIVRGEVDVALAHPRTPAEYMETLRSIQGETERMARLVNGLLLLARSDAAELELEWEQVDLADLLTLLVEQMQSEAEAAKVTLATELPTPLVLWGDRDRLLQLFINLLENTLIYAPGSQVRIQCHVDGGDLVITVADTGAGIAPGHLPHLFERFYRVEKTRNRASGGSGLGLAIAQEIVHAHHGIIQVASEVNRGTTFTIRLPQDHQDQQHRHVQQQKATDQ